MGRHDDCAGFGQFLTKAQSCGDRLRPIVSATKVKRLVGQLQRVVESVPSRDKVAPVVRKAQNRMAECMPDCGFNKDSRRDFVPVRHDFGQACVQNRLNAVFKNADIIIDHSMLLAFSAPSLELLVDEKIAGTRESRHTDVFIPALFHPQGSQ